MSLDTPEAVRLQGELNAVALEILAKAKTSGLAPSTLCGEAVGSGLRVAVLVVPYTEKIPESLTPCERDILTMLAAVRVRSTAPRIAAWLEERGILHGESTIRTALASMVRRGFITSSRRTPQGYALVAA